MKTIEVHLVNAFTAFDEGGNPAGVVLNADSLSAEEKLKVAQAVGYSETAFVSKDEYADVALSFFTVTGEVDFCGHATLAAFSLMFQQGILQAGDYTQRTKAGMLGVSITGDGNVVMEQKSPEFTQRLPYEDVSELIGIAPDVLASTQLPIEVVSTGLPDIIVAVPTGYLSKIDLNADKTTEFCRQHNAVGIHAFEICESSSNLTASCRNFAPLLGIAEESATGSASGALACYLAKHSIEEIDSKGSSSENCSKHQRALTKVNPTFNFVFEQGRAMGCVSRILATVAIKDSENTQWEVSVVGLASLIGKKAIELRSPSI